MPHKSAKVIKNGSLSEWPQHPHNRSHRRRNMRDSMVEKPYLKRKSLRIKINQNLAMSPGYIIVKLYSVEDRDKCKVYHTMDKLLEKEQQLN